MWAIGIFDLGLSHKTFWRLTLKEFEALCIRKRIDDRRVESNSALIACVLANINRKKGKPPYKVTDFMSKEANEKTMDWRKMKGLLKSMAVKRGVIKHGR